jgi:hypothetical protein
MDRITVLYCVNVNGTDKKKPCFQQFALLKKKLPIGYYANKNT